jgi:hypothetical protein
LGCKHVADGSGEEDGGYLEISEGVVVGEEGEDGANRGVEKAEGDE